jgi:MFS family permease
VLWIALSVSAVGTWMQIVALSLLVLQLRHGSALALGEVSLTQAIAFIVFAPRAGAIADRFDKRRLLLVTQTIPMALAAILGSSRTSALYASGWFSRSLSLPHQLARLPTRLPRWRNMAPLASAGSSSGRMPVSVCRLDLVRRVVLAGTGPEGGEGYLYGPEVAATATWDGVPRRFPIPVL